MKVFESGDEKRFESEDGIMFPTEQECADHEAWVASERNLNDYVEELKKAGVPDKVISRYRAGAHAYLKWAALGELPEYKERPRTAPKKEKATPKSKSKAEPKAA